MTHRTMSERSYHGAYIHTNIHTEINRQTDRLDRQTERKNASQIDRINRSTK